MNILVTTFSLLLILGISASLFWKEAIGSASSIKAVKGFYEAARNAQNKAEKKQYSRWKDLTSATQKSKGTSLSTKIFVSHRALSPPLEQGCLHIAPLWTEEYRPIFQRTLEKLLNELYGHTTWYDQALAKRLIQQLASLKEGFDEQIFHEKLDKDVYSLWYHMAKGTQSYDIEHKIGYPPITDYLDFSPSSSIKQTCCFAFAPIPVLNSLFGPEITKKILSIEQSKWEEDHRHHFCLKKDLLTLLGTSRQGSEHVNFTETFLYFKQSVGRRAFVEGEEEKAA